MSDSRQYSLSPAGEKFALPGPEDYAAEMKRLEAAASAARAEGKEVVVVMGVGFVGAVMAAIVADSADRADRPAREVRDRLSAAEHAQFLEDPLAQPRGGPGEGGGPGGRPHDHALREREEDAHRDL